MTSMTEDQIKSVKKSKIVQCTCGQCGARHWKKINRELQQTWSVN